FHEWLNEAFHRISCAVTEVGEHREHRHLAQRDEIHCWAKVRPSEHHPQDHNEQQHCVVPKALPFPKVCGILQVHSLSIAAGMRFVHQINLSNVLCIAKCDWPKKKAYDSRVTRIHSSIRSRYSSGAAGRFAGSLYSVRGTRPSKNFTHEM